MLWYCAFRGKHHTRFVKRFDFCGIRRIGKEKCKANLCGKGILFLVLAKDILLNSDIDRICRSVSKSLEKAFNII